MEFTARFMQSELQDFIMNSL